LPDNLDGTERSKAFDKIAADLAETFKRSEKEMRKLLPKLWKQPKIPPPL
jgi:hypothetical protein